MQTRWATTAEELAPNHLETGTPQLLARGPRRLQPLLDRMDLEPLTRPAFLRIQDGEVFLRDGEVELEPLWDAAEHDWLAFGRRWGLAPQLPFVSGWRPLVQPGTRVERVGPRCRIEARIPWFGAVERGRGDSGNPVLDSLVRCVGELPEAAIGPMLELVHGLPGTAQGGLLRSEVPVGDVQIAMQHLLQLRRNLSAPLQSEAPC